MKYSNTKVAMWNNSEPAELSSIAVNPNFEWCFQSKSELRTTVARDCDGKRPDFRMKGPVKSSTSILRCPPAQLMTCWKSVQYNSNYLQFANMPLSDSRGLWKHAVLRYVAIFAQKKSRISPICWETGRFSAVTHSIFIYNLLASLIRNRDWS